VPEKNLRRSNRIEPISEHFPNVYRNRETDGQELPQSIPPEEPAHLEDPGPPPDPIEPDELEKRGQSESRQETVEREKIEEGEHDDDVEQRHDHHDLAQADELMDGSERDHVAGEKPCHDRVDSDGGQSPELLLLDDPSPPNEKPPEEAGDEHRLDQRPGEEEGTSPGCLFLFSLPPKDGNPPLRTDLHAR
jgi:hypothetical protein